MQSPDRPVAVVSLAISLLISGEAAADALDDAVRATMREHGVVGLSLAMLAIVRDGKIVRAGG